MILDLYLRLYFRLIIRLAFEFSKNLVLWVKSFININYVTWPKVFSIKTRVKVWIMHLFNHLECDFEILINRFVSLVIAPFWGLAWNTPRSLRVLTIFFLSHFFMQLSKSLSVLFIFVFVCFLLGNLVLLPFTFQFKSLLSYFFWSLLRCKLILGLILWNALYLLPNAECNMETLNLFSILIGIMAFYELENIISNCLVWFCL